VAVGSGTILTSPDGVTWTERTSGTTNLIFGVTYGNSTFVAVGSGTILTSPDGVTWTERTSGAFYYIYYISGVTYGNGTFVAVGDGGSILQSDPVSGNGTAILSADQSLHIPIISFNGAYLWYDATCSAAADGSVTCMVKNYGVANPADFSTCEISTLSSDMKLHIPFVIYNNRSYQADFEYVPTIDGQIWFNLVGATQELGAFLNCLFVSKIFIGAIF